MWITLKFLGSRTRKFQAIIFIQKRTYRETLKFALVYPNIRNENHKNAKQIATKTPKK